MKTIRGKLLFNMVGGMAVLAILISTMSAWFCMKSTVNSTESDLIETAQVAADQILARLQGYEKVVFEIGCIDDLSDPATTVAEKKAMIDQRVQINGFARGNVVDANGISPIDGLDLSDREYFKQSMNGVSWISEPAISKSTGDMVVMISAPIWQGGVPNSKVVGVVYFTQDVNMLRDLVNNIKIGNTGVTYILNKDGVTIAHPNAEIVKTMENSQELVKTDPQMKQLADLEAKMINGESGFGEYVYHGVRKYLAYAPIDVPSKWSIAISIEKRELLAYTNRSVVLLALASVGLLIIFSLGSLRFAKMLSTSITRVTKRLELMVQGDLHSPVEQETSKDEIGRLAKSLEVTVNTLNGYVIDIDRAMSAMSNGNFDIAPSQPFIGDFAGIEKSITKFIFSISNALNQVNISSDYVSHSSAQLANGAQVLSQGAAEQSASVEELYSELGILESQMKHSAQNAQQAKSETAQVGGQVEASSRKMNEMIAAMNDISAKSGEIGKIIKTIDDIAFQTNILALNAAVEAARAGAAGKGFAVVADEVRNLAGKSAAAAKDTTTLIEETVWAVGKGTQIANDTAAALSGVVEGSTGVSKLIDEIAEVVNEQASSITTVSAGMGEIAKVVQTNSATAEESAAASEELSAQADELKLLVAKFNIKKEMLSKAGELVTK